MARRVQESKNYFSVLVDGIRVGDFLKVSGLSTYVNVDEEKSRNSNLIEKSPGASGCNNVILYKKRTREQPFWNWLKAIQSGNFEKKTIAIELIYRNKPLRGWKLINCWPCRWTISDITDEGVVNTVEEIELVVEEIELL